MSYFTDVWRKTIFAPLNLSNKIIWNELNVCHCSFLQKFIFHLYVLRLTKFPQFWLALQCCHQNILKPSLTVAPIAETMHCSLTCTNFFVFIYTLWDCSIMMLLSHSNPSLSFRCFNSYLGQKVPESEFSGRGASEACKRRGQKVLFDRGAH
jgi:hypothetical protein